MKLDHVIRILFILIIIGAFAVGAFGYTVYNNLCNSQDSYEGVEYIYSSDAYKVCGSTFGIVNTSDEDIKVTKVIAEGINDYDATEIAAVDPTNEEFIVASGEGYAIEASGDVAYKIDSPSGSNLDNEVQVRKF